ncbi:MAG: PorV/PorQ family protein [Candidatus Delongbacteria bacterium]
MNTTLALSALLLLVGTSRAATGLAFLKIAADAGSAGLGESTAGAWEDALSPLRNPATAPADERWHLAFTRADWIFESDYSALAVQLPLGRWSLGADLRVLTIEDIEQRDSPDPEPEGYYRVDDLAYGLRLSAPLGKSLRAGAALRRVQEKINQEDSRGWVGDLGLRWERPGADPSRLLGVSLAVRNLGSSSEFVDESPDPPRTFSLGVERRGPLPLVGWTTSLQAEARQLQDEDTHLHLGVQTFPVGGLALRGGWMTGYDERGGTLGVGFVWRQMKLDYAWLPFRNALNDSHRFTFSFAM